MSNKNDYLGVQIVNATASAEQCHAATSGVWHQISRGTPAFLKRLGHTRRPDFIRAVCEAMRQLRSTVDDLANRVEAIGRGYCAAALSPRCIIGDYHAASYHDCVLGFANEHMLQDAAKAIGVTNLADQSERNKGLYRYWCADVDELAPRVAKHFAKLRRHVISRRMLDDTDTSFDLMTLLQKEAARVAVMLKANPDARPAYDKNGDVTPGEQCVRDFLYAQHAPMKAPAIAQEITNGGKAIMTSDAVRKHVMSLKRKGCRIRSADDGYILEP